MGTLIGDAVNTNQHTRIGPIDSRSRYLQLVQPLAPFVLERCSHKIVETCNGRTRRQTRPKSGRHPPENASSPPTPPWASRHSAHAGVGPVLDGSSVERVYNAHRGGAGGDTRTQRWMDHRHVHRDGLSAPVQGQDGGRTTAGVGELLLQRTPPNIGLHTVDRLQHGR